MSYKSTVENGREGAKPDTGHTRGRAKFSREASAAGRCARLRRARERPLVRGPPSPQHRRISYNASYALKHARCRTPRAERRLLRRRLSGRLAARGAHKQHYRTCGGAAPTARACVAPRARCPSVRVPCRSSRARCAPLQGCALLAAVWWALCRAPRSALAGRSGCVPRRACPRAVNCCRAPLGPLRGVGWPHCITQGCAGGCGAAFHIEQKKFRVEHSGVFYAEQKTTRACCTM